MTKTKNVEMNQSNDVSGAKNTIRIQAVEEEMGTEFSLNIQTMFQIKHSAPDEKG